MSYGPERLDTEYQQFDADQPAAPPAVESAAYLARQIVGVKHPKSSRSRTRVLVAERELANWEAAIRAAERAPLIARVGELEAANASLDARIAAQRQIIDDALEILASRVYPGDLCDQIQMAVNDIETFRTQRDAANERDQRAEAALEIKPPDVLMAKARQHARNNGMTLTDVMNDALSWYFDRRLYIKATQRDDRAEEGERDG